MPGDIRLFTEIGGVKTDVTSKLQAAVKRFEIYKETDGEYYMKFFPDQSTPGNPLNSKNYIPWRNNDEDPIEALITYSSQGCGSTICSKVTVNGVLKYDNSNNSNQKRLIQIIK